MFKDKFDQVIANIYTQKSLFDNNHSVDSVIISNGEIELQHYFRSESELHKVRSISKIIVALCYGLLIYDRFITFNGGIIGIDTKIWPIIKGKVSVINNKNVEKLKKVTIEHLLTHTTGYDRELLFSADIKEVPPDNLLQILCEEPIVFEPGEHFIYSNASAYLLSVIFQEIMGQNLSTFAYDRILSKLGIKTYTWENYGNYCAGATGLALFNKDLHKIGKLLIQDGKWDGIQVIPREWIKEMTTAHYFTPEKFKSEDQFSPYAYGYFVWLCQNGTFFIKGFGGQYLIVNPSSNIVITILADILDVNILTSCLNPIQE